MPLDPAYKDRLRQRVKGVFDRLDDEGRRNFWSAINRRALEGGVKPGSEEHAELYNVVREVNPTMAPWDAEPGWSEDGFLKRASAAVITGARALTNTALFGYGDEALGGINDLMEAAQPGSGVNPVQEGLGVEEWLAKKAPLAHTVSSGVGTVLGLGTPVGFAGALMRALPVVGRGLKATEGFGRAVDSLGRAGAALPGLGALGARLGGEAIRGGAAFGAYEGLRDPDVAALDPAAPEGYRNVPPGETIPGTEAQVPGRLENALHGAWFGALSAPVMAAAHFVTPRLQKVLGERLGSMVGGGLEFSGFAALPTAGHESVVQTLLRGDLDEAGVRLLAETLTGAIVKGLAPTPYRGVPGARPLVTKEQAAKDLTDAATKELGKINEEQRAAREAQEEGQQKAAEAAQPREDGDWLVNPVDDANPDIPYAFYRSGKDLRTGKADPRTAKIAVRYDPEADEHVVVRPGGKEVARFKTGAASRAAAEQYADEPEVAKAADAERKEEPAKPAPEVSNAAEKPVEAPVPAEPPPVRRTSETRLKAYQEARAAALDAQKADGPSKVAKRLAKQARRAWDALHPETRNRLRAEQPDVAPWEQAVPAPAPPAPAAAGIAEAPGKAAEAPRAPDAPTATPEPAGAGAKAGAAGAAAQPEARGTAVKVRLIPGRDGMLIQPIDADGKPVGDPYPSSERHPERFAKEGAEPPRPPPAKGEKAPEKAPEPEPEAPKAPDFDSQAEWDRIAAEELGGAKASTPEPAARGEARAEETAPKPSAPSEKMVEEGRPTEGFGSSNTVFTRDALQETLRKLGIDAKDRLSAGFDPVQAMRATVQMLGYYVEGGVRLGIRTYRALYERIAPLIEDIRKQSAETADAILRNLGKAWAAVKRNLTAKGLEVSFPDEPGADGLPKDAPMDTSTISPTETANIARVLVPAFRKLLKEARDGGRKITTDELRRLSEELTGRERASIEDETWDALEVAAQETSREAFESTKRWRDAMRAAWEAEEALPNRKRTLEIAARQQFSTPLPIATAAAVLGVPRNTDRILEPTAGTGNMVNLIPRDWKVTVREIDPRRVRMLREAGWKDVREGDFLTHGTREPGTYDLVLANYPWSANLGKEHGWADVNGRFAWFAAKDLKEGGRMVMVVSETGLRDLPKLHEESGLVPRAIIATPEDWYAQKSAGAAARIVVLDKAPGEKWKEPERVEVKTLEDLMDAVARVSPAHPRMVTSEAPAAPPATSGRAPKVRPPRAGADHHRPRDPHQPANRPEHITSLLNNTASHSESERREVEHRARHGFTVPTMSRKGLTGTDYVVYEAQSPDASRTVEGTRADEIIVETSGMASVPAPNLTVRLHPSTVALNRARPGEVRARLADDQIDAVARSAQAAKMGHGIVIAAEVGVGKTRSMMGTLNELWHGEYGPGSKGHQRILVITDRPGDSVGLIEGGGADVFDADNPLGLNKEKAADLGRFPFPVAVANIQYPGSKIPDSPDRDRVPLANAGFQKGVLVIDRTNLPKYLDSILEWGPSALFVDEADAWRNTENADKKAQAMAWSNLHKYLLGRPNSDNVAFNYYTATPGSHVGRLRYLYGLRLWHPNTFDQYVMEVTGNQPRGAHTPEGARAADRAGGGQFDDADAETRETSNPHARFALNDMSEGEMEQIMREWKARGRIWATDIWRGNLDFDAEVKDVTPEETALLDGVASLRRTITDANRRFGAIAKNRKKRSPVSFLQNATKLALARIRAERSIPLAIERLKQGHQVVIVMDYVSGQKTDEGFWKAALDTIDAKRLVENPTTGEVVEQVIPEAQDLIASIKERLQAAAFSEDSPISVIKQGLKDYRVEAITGSSEHARSDAVNRKNIAAFNRGEIRVLVISGKGKRAISLHQKQLLPHLGPAAGRRVMLVTDYDYDINALRQAFGRVDRSGQKTSPIIRVLGMGLGQERKFLATVSKRMRGLGSVSSAQTGSKGGKALNDFVSSTRFERHVIAETWRELERMRQEAAREDRAFDDPREYFTERQGFTVKRPDPRGRDFPPIEAPRADVEGNRDLDYEFGMQLQSIPIRASKALMEVFERVALRERDSEAGKLILEAEDMNARGRILGRVTADGVNRSELITYEYEADEVLRRVRVKQRPNEKGEMEDFESSWYEKTGKRVKKVGVLLSGLFMHDDRYVTVSQLAKRANIGHGGTMRWLKQFVRLHDESTGETVSGLRMDGSPDSLKQVMRAYSREGVGRVYRADTALTDVRQGNEVPLIPPASAKTDKGWVLREVMAGEAKGRVEIHGASRSALSDRESGKPIYPGLEYHTAGSGRWLVAEPAEQNLPVLLERLRIDHRVSGESALAPEEAEALTTARAARRAELQALSGEAPVTERAQDARENIRDNCQ